MQIIKRLILNLLKRYYGLLPTLDSFTQASKETSRLLVITQSRSWMIEALINSVSEQADLGKAVYCSKAVFDTTNGDDRNMHSPRVLWLSIHDLEALKLSLDNLNDPSTRYSTLNVFRGKGPIKNRPNYKTTWRDYIALLLAPLLQSRFLVVFFGDSSHLPTFDTPSSHRLGRHFKLDFYRNLKMVRGTPFQSFAAQRRVVLSGQEYDREIQAIATHSGTSVKKTHKKAIKTFNGMAARPFAPIYIPAAVLIRFILNRLFSGKTVRGLDRFASAVKKDTVILVPMHRSHLDYLLLGSILFDANLNSAVVAAGVNLSFWPFGNIIRGLGGYFVKRNARQDRIHSLVLRRYVTYLVKRGHLQEFFIEGGRSRSGRMRAPRLGLLNIMVSAYLRGERKDILFVPVSICYEHVIEDGVYGKENTGLDKTKENLASLFRARSIFRQDYKELIIQFGKPLRLSQFRKDLRLEERKRRPLVSKLGNALTRSIELQSSVGLRNLTCTALLIAPRYGLPREKLEQRVRDLAHLASLFHEVHPEYDGGEFTPSLQRYLDQKEDNSIDISGGGIITTHPSLGSDIMYLPGSVRFTADFYKNSTLHVFFPVGVLSLVQLSGKDLTAENCLSLYSIFQHDYLLQEQQPFLHEMQKMIALLEGEGILIKADSKLQFASTTNGLFLPALLQAPIQSLLWVHYNLQSFPSTEGDSTKAADAAQSKAKRVLHYSSFLKTLQDDFLTMKYHGSLHCTEASSLVSLTSTLDALRARDIIQVTHSRGKRAEIEVLQECYDEVLQLEQLNSLILQWQVAQPTFAARST